MPIACVALTLLAGLAAPASAAGPVAMSLMKMDWDNRDPTRLPYQEFNIDSTIDNAFKQSWADARVTMADKVVAAVTAPNALKSGITLYDVDLRLTPADPVVSLVVAGATAGTMRLSLPNNLITFTARNSITPGYADPTFRATFDIVVDINFGLSRSNINMLPVSSSTATLANTHVSAVNLPAIYAAMGSETLADIFGWKSLPDRIRDGMNASRIDVGQLSGRSMSKSIALLMTGYDSTGGRIVNGRIIIAGARIKSLPAADVWLRAHWNASLGRVLPNCDAVEFAITVPYAPPNYGDLAPLTKQLRPQGDSGSVPTGGDLACTQKITSLQGVPATLQYKEAIGNGGGNLTPGVARTLHIVPVTLPTPIIVGDVARGKADFVVEVKDAMHDGKRLLDQAAALRNPGDPVDRSGKASLGDPADARSLPAASRAANGNRVADELNPQPLPPGPPPEMKLGNTPKIVAPASSAKSQPLATGSALKTNASRVDTSSTTNAPGSALQPALR
jgi:hypothetical protein